MDLIDDISLEKNKLNIKTSSKKSCLEKINQIKEATQKKLDNYLFTVNLSFKFFENSIPEEFIADATAHELNKQGYELVDVKEINIQDRVIDNRFYHYVIYIVYNFILTFFLSPFMFCIKK